MTNSSPVPTHSESRETSAKKAGRTLRPLLQPGKQPEAKEEGSVVCPHGSPRRRASPPTTSAQQGLRTLEKAPAIPCGCVPWPQEPGRTTDTYRPYPLPLCYATLSAFYTLISVTRTFRENFLPAFALCDWVVSLTWSLGRGGGGCF